MIIQGDNMKIMPTLDAESFHTCVTSPPYWGLRDYGIPPSDWPEVTYTPMPGLPPLTVPPWTGCLGLEPTPEMFVAHNLVVFREVWRLLRDDGTLWLNFGDAYATAGYKTHSSNSDVSGWDSDRRGQSVAKTAVSGIKVKDLLGIPWRVVFALQADGWYVRSDIIWAKPNPMPESTKDRPTKAHEYMFLLSKSDRYYYDQEAIKEPGVQDEWANGFRGGAYVADNTFDNQEGGKRKTRGNIRVGNEGARKVIKANSFARRVKDSPPPGQPSQHRLDRKDIEYKGMRNKRSVWTVATQPFPEAHFATFPERLIEPCILAGAPVGGRVLDPFGGSGTTLKVAQKNNRECTIIEIGPHYVDIAKRRTAIIQPVLNI
ncbi:site-specific DNA-methyltransferase [Paenibacillus sp. FSL R5-0527]|uniref:DNA-methyltransferase n=1 Tax=Paenibacillus sp. FSL R5-0527 TaxID=2975321 RepID=UPI00097B5E39|nr:site-specific DNA-methyltransferase [Paenibacillus macerans]